MKQIVLISLILCVVVFVGQGIYKQLNKGARSKRLPCQKEVIVFERIYDKERIKNIKELIQKDAFSLHVEAKKAVYSRSKLFDFVDIKDVHVKAKEVFLKYKKDSSISEKPLHVELKVYENDKDNPGKKTPASKLYAGYLVFNCFIKDQLIYKVQLDFMKKHGEDIPKRIECGIKSLMTLN